MLFKPSYSAPFWQWVSCMPLTTEMQAVELSLGSVNSLALSSSASVCVRLRGVRGVLGTQEVGPVKGEFEL